MGRSDLRQFMAELDAAGMLVRVAEPVSLVHEMTEIHRRVLAARGPAILFERPVDAAGSELCYPVLVNLFGTPQRVAMGLGIEAAGMAELGETLAYLRHPEPPATLRGALRRLPELRAALAMGTRSVSRPPVQQVVVPAAELDLGALPIQWCWPGEPAPLITWPLVVTRDPDDAADINVGVYRLQVLGRGRLIVRWLPGRGGARHFARWQARGEDMPIAIAIGADPATMLAAAMPIPDGVSELAFAGLLRREKTGVARAVSVDLPVPANAEFVLEGAVSSTERAPEGPYGDHTGYYNAVEPFPVVTLGAITHRHDPTYVSTFTGRPPDEPAVLAEALGGLFVPLVRRQFPEIRDVHFPSAACSYRFAIVAIDKRYPGQARRVMLGLWSMLPQFMMTKTIVVVDAADIDIRNWDDVLWAISTRFDASRDLVQLDNTPIDYLDFASPLPGLGGKIGLDATNKIGAETARPWGRVLAMSSEAMSRIDEIWPRLGLGAAP
ncbi:MAG: 3-octaprenyl-4-hydroxybenzoate carboxy-lyase [Devosia sp. 67-54]|uniref:UbiD family decarboxylase n=1 Tax=unclassified Devosia TaxID=196773 RepID=UPI00095BCE69|nr:MULTISPECIES: UbiD family decarboxylase [unclassified Devosia]MBN9305493.1 UbiD family decarboxylase [Devosia sp.]OJX19079.1 MAG: 3-octaprenyl-4-hydroxybenzoate carboxy-lyase [Devosia sp. 67-54]